MKVIKKIIFILAVCFTIGLTSSISVSAEAIVTETASNNGMTVVVELVDEKLDLTISGIKIVEKEQVLTYSLVSEDTTGNILYANAKYVNGETAMTESISFADEGLTEEKLNGCVLTVQNAAGEQKVSIRFNLEAAPTAAPTTAPTAAPTTEPTAAPTAEPTAEPTAAPTAAPTATPEETSTPTPIEDDEEEVQPESTPADEALQTTSTDTGDESKIGISICMLVVSLVIMLALIVTYSKNKVHGRTTEKED